MKHSHYQQVMNDTKWKELRAAMYNYPDNLQWRTKDIETGYICPWDGDWFHHFKSGGYISIEWLKIKAETEELRKDLTAVLRNIHVPGEVILDVIRVYGYVKKGGFIDYL
ncbi:hypothetical protein QWY14_04135 [Planococcus sp. N028]|uniref:Uncharacterized protein n=1 Tax=Planococcus shixiaomingii TaxID=3058393 RepID=A0ABT8MZB5_9BACL|nr:DUF6678 family protein [Planococcus sp. N028]MDN7240963.1 hypothetical protein [Planococcus sp. N028]